MVRAADIAEAALLSELVRAAFAEYEGQLDPPSSARRDTPEVVRARIAEGGALVAERDGAPAACVFWQRRDDHLYLSRLSVLPAHRGAGIGRELVAAVERLARAEGLGCVRLSVRLALPHNLAYYRRQGYEVASYGTHAGYPAPTFANLEKRLPAGVGAGPPREP